MPRFSLKTLLLSTTLIAVGVWIVTLGVPDLWFFAILLSGAGLYAMFPKANWINVIGITSVAIVTIFLLWLLYLGVTATI